MPATAAWEKPGKGDPLVMRRPSPSSPRGVALVIGCNTFPTWNSYPGLFASLVTGNPVVVKPHPGAVLPLAITVEVAGRCWPRPASTRTWSTLAAEATDDGLAATLATRPEVRLVDFTGGNAFGDWLEAHARQATVFTEKAGVNTVVIDSTTTCRRCAATSPSRWPSTPARCAPRRRTSTSRPPASAPDGTVSPAEVAQGIDEGPRRAPRRRRQGRRAARRDGDPRPSSSASRPPAPARACWSPGATSRTRPTPTRPCARPPLVGLTAADSDVYESECFGPVAYLIETAGTDESIDLFRDTVQRARRDDRRRLLDLRRRASSGCATPPSTPGSR